MTELKRYTPVADYIGSGDYIGDATVDEDGDYVLYTDAMEAIRKAREEALEDREMLVALWEHATERYSPINEQSALWARIRERVAAIRALKSEGE